jgi:hypothetical protein
MAVIGGSSPVKSIQRGNVSLGYNGGTSNVTINAVVLANTFVSISCKSAKAAMNMGYHGSTIDSGREGQCSPTAGGYLSATTTLACANGAIYTYGAIISSASATLYWEVIEYV